MQSSFVIFFIIIGIIFGDWKRWNEYYPTLLFWIIGNLFQGTALYHYRVWEFIPVGMDHLLLPTHTVIGLAITGIIYPFVIPVFLGRLPETLFKKICWIIFWILIFQVVETIAYINNSITYHHGWSLGWSFIFNVVTFALLPIHQWKSWLAWLLGVLFIVILWIIFHPPIPE
ncbi:MAG: CBO0543 family protein [Heyndrickxia sp.]